MANAEEKLRKYLQEIAKNEKYEQSKIVIKPISSGGANYSTILFLATISEPPKPDLHLFAKVANFPEEFRAKNAAMVKMYLVEGLFYTELTDNFDRIYNKNSVPIADRLRKPKYYGHILTHLEETLVLENLEASGYNHFDRMKAFNWDYASTAMTELARFHAIGLAFKHDNPKEFEDTVRRVNVDIHEDYQQMEMFMMQAVLDSLEAVDGEHKVRLQNYLTPDMLKELINQFMGNNTMLIHGDFRPSNLMHRRKAGKLEIITLDYQTLRLGKPVGDIMYFIFSGSDEEFRRLHYRRLLDHYFNQLTLALKQLNLDVEDVYSKNTFELDLVEMKPMGLFISLAMTGLFMVDSEDAPTMDADMASFTVKPNKRAQERINGVVRDYVRWGVL